MGAAGALVVVLVKPLPWAIASDVPSTSPGHRTNSGAHGEAYSTRTYAFKHSFRRELSYSVIQRYTALYTIQLYSLYIIQRYTITLCMAPCLNLTNCVECRA